MHSTDETGTANRSCLDFKELVLNRSYLNDSFEYTRLVSSQFQTLSWWSSKQCLMPQMQSHGHTPTDHDGI
jgi:hypothetical protein